MSFALFSAAVCFGATLCAAQCVPACDVGTTFCNAGGKCEDIPYAPIVTASASPLGSTQAFSVLMVSDMQFYFTNCKDAPSGSCIFDSGPSNAALDDAVTAQADCVKTMAADAANNVKAIFDGGDVTNTGANSELRKYKQLFYRPVRTANKPRYINLGNHDYYNEGPSERARRRMIAFLGDSLQGLPVSAVDFGTTTVDDYATGAAVPTKFTKGSLGYTVDIEGFVFVFTHWAMSLKNGGVYVDTFETSATGSEPRNVVSLTHVQEFLYSVFQDPTNAGKKFVLVPHSIRTVTKFMCQQAETALLSLFASKVVAILSGHDHDQWGFYGNYDVTKDGPNENCPSSGTSSQAFSFDGSQPGIPVFYAGSSSYQTLIKANFDFSASPPVQVDAYTTDPSLQEACTTPIERDIDPKFGV